MGKNAQFDELPAAATRLADRTLLTALLAWRLTGLTTGAAALVAGRDRYRSRPVALAQLAFAAAESAWYARRVWRRNRWSDATATRLDAAAAAAALLVGQANLAPADRVTWINWAPWTIGANAVCAQAMGEPQLATASLGAAAVIGTYATQSQRAGDAVANSAALSAFFAVARMFAAQIRISAVRLERSRREAVREGRALARARERSVQLRLLHDHALQTLETIAGGRFRDIASVRHRAGSEAAQLNRELARGRTAQVTLAERLEAVRTAHAGEGLRVDLACPAALVLPDDATDALCGAANEALTNVRKHAHTGSAEVRVAAAAGRVVVTITDAGGGFDRSAALKGFGMGESIERRMHDAGGEAAVHSTIGVGTSVTLRWPR